MIQVSPAHRVNTSEEFPVAERHAAASVDNYSILPIWKAFCHYSRCVPFLWFVASLVLNLHSVTLQEVTQNSICYCWIVFKLAFGKGALSSLSDGLPFTTDVIHLPWQMVSHRTAI